MDLQERLSYLEINRDWRSLVDELEKAIAAADGAELRASLHLRLGRLYEEKFLAGVKALRHYQDAYKLNPALLESLGAARGIYWDLGKLNMVQKLLELELKSPRSADQSTALLVELGDVLCDSGDYDKATATYAKALAASGGDSVAASARLEDVQVAGDSWQAHVASLLRAAGESAESATLYLRAARVARRFAPDEVEGLLLKAYSAAPMSRDVAANYESAITERNALDELEPTQAELLSSLPDLKQRGALACAFGARWSSRHQNADVGAGFLEQAVKCDASQEGAFNVLREVYGTKAGDWDRVLGLAEAALASDSGAAVSSFYGAQSATIAWRETADLARARASFERLAASCPEHPQVRAFELQIGESVRLVPPSEEPVGASEDVDDEGLVEMVSLDDVSIGDVAAPAESGLVVPQEAAEVAPADAPPVEIAKEPAPLPAPEPVAVDQAKIDELRAAAEKQEAAKRFNEYAKTVLQLAALVPDVAEKVALYTKAAELYVSKFANPGEAVKAYEAVLALDSDNAAAVDFLRPMYEKRRDWEKLLVLQRRDAAALPAGAARGAKLLETAKLATERIRNNPEVCIELWQEVLANDASNVDALGALGQLYERSKDFERLAEVLEKQSEVTYDDQARIQILNKLGTIYSERLSNEDGAVTAWRTLLTLDPNDRRAQEALKKKYLALGRWDDLEVFYAESGKWDEFIRVLEQQEAKETAGDAKLGMLFKIAELWADKKQKSDRAAKAYEKVLELDADNLRAAEALVPIYTAAGNAKLLVGALEVKLSHERDAAARLALLRELAAIYETKVKDPSKAFERYLAAFELASDDEMTIVDAERAAKAAGEWEKLIVSYGRAIAAAVEDGNATASIELRLALGRVLTDEVGRVDDALEVYRAVYEIESDNEVALEALERLYRQVGRVSELLSIYERRRDLAVDAADKKRIQFELAKLYETELKDVDRAIATYLAVLEDEPTDGPALEAVEALYAQLSRWQDYAAILRRRIESDAGESELVELKYKLGQTLEKHLGDAPGALENYREILYLDAQHAPAKGALEALLAHPELRGDAAGILEPIYEEAAEWSKLADVLEILASTELALGRRVQLLRKAARIAGEQLGDFGRAFTLLSSALKDDPSLLETREEIEKVVESAGSHAALVALYESVAAAVADASLAREYWLKVAGIEERLDRVDAAAAAYARVLEADAADSDALAALERLFARTGRWADLVGVLERRADQSSDAEVREELLAQMADVQDRRLGSAAQAIASYRKVLETDPASLRALTALDGLFSRENMHADLAENLDAQLALAATEDAQLALMLRVAGLREAHMGQVDVALEGYRQVLDRDPTNAEALAALERLGRDPAHALAIADLLEPLYRQTGDFQKLIGVHEVQVSRADDSARKVELLHQIAQLFEDAAGDANQAFSTLARALAEDAASEQTQQSLDRVARGAGRLADLAGVYEQRAAAASDPDLSSALYAMSARIHEEDLADVDAAIARYRKVLEIDPANLVAAESLERLYRSSERYAELSAILQRKAEIVDALHEKKDALFQAAAIEEDILQRPDAAIAVYNRVLEVDGDDLRALDALIKRYLGLSRWNDLLSVYARKVDLISDADEKKRIYYQVGAVYERELSDVARAIDTYQKILELDPDDLQALSRLDVLYEQAQNWAELLSVLNRQGEMTADAAEAISYQYRVAELYEKRLEDAPRAIELYRDILAQEPGHEPTLRALESMKAGGSNTLGAAGVLESVYEAASDWRNLVGVYEVQVAHADDPFQKVELLHRIARLHEDALDALGAAFDTYARALPLDDSNHETLAHLERLAAATERWGDVARLYDTALAGLAGDPDRFVELALRIAQIYETQLESSAEAIIRYKRALEVDGENQASLSALDRLYSQTQRWSELAVILSREADVGQTPDEILAFKHRLGQLNQTRLGNLDGAIAAYREVLAAAPEQTETVEALEALFAAGTKQVEIGEILEPIYRASGEWEKLRSVFEAQLAHAPASGADGDEGSSEDRLAAYYRIAELVEEKLIDGAAALEVYARAVKEFPLDEKCAEELPRLAASVDEGFEAVANAYADVLGAHSDPHVQAVIGKRLAKLFEDDLGDITKAEETYKYVLTVAPLDSEALSDLDRIYESIESWPELAGVLEQRLRAGGEPHELTEIHVRLGELYEQRIGDVDSAMRVYRRLFDGLDPANDAAIAALGRIYEQKQAYGELMAVYERELANASGDAAEADIRSKIAHLCADRLGDDLRAVDTWKIVLDLRGEDTEALSALSRLYERQGAFRELVEILEREGAATIDDDARVSILTRRALVFSQHLQRDEMALEEYMRVLDIDVANLASLRAIAAIRRRAGDAYELVGALHQIVDRAAAYLDEAELKGIFRELAKTYGEQLQQPFDAADAWRKLLEVGADAEAMDALEALYRAEERWHEVIEVKMRRAASFEGAPEQLAEYREIAALWADTVHEPDGATAAYQKMLEIDASSDEAFDALEKLHAAAGRWEPLVELLLGRLESRELASQRAELLRKIARVFEEHLDDKGQALDALINALSEDFHDRETARYLERIAQATGRWNEVIKTASEWLQEQTDPKQKIRLCLHLAKWYGEDLGRPEYAQPYYAQIVQLDPNNVGALRQMAQLHRKSANWQQLGATLTRALEVAVGDEERKELLNELGELLDQHMGQTEQGMTYFERALEVDPNFVPALENLERIYTARGQTRELVEVLVRMAASQSDPAAAVQSKLRVGSLFETTLADTARAAQVYREVLEIDASNVNAMRGLVRACEGLQEWPELVKVLEAQLDVVNSERERVDILMQLANLHEEQFLKSELAAARLEQVLEIDPNHEDAYFALERNYRKLRQWHELVATYERHVSIAADRKTKVENYGFVAQIFAEEIVDVDRAIEAYRNLLDLDDSHVPALEAIAKLYEKQGDTAQSIEFTMRVADLTSDSKTRVEAYYRIGKIQDEKLGDRISARDSFDKVLELDPAHLPTLASLRQIALDDTDYYKAVEYMDLEQSHTQSARQRARLLVEIGKLRSEKLDEKDAAIVAWEAAFQADPENEDAAMPLASEYVAAERWEAAEPLLEMLVRKSGKRDRHEQHELQSKLGTVSIKLGKDDRALKAFTAALQLDQTSAETIRGLADVSFRLKDWAAALSNYQKVLTSLSEDETEARAEVYYRLGCVKREQGQAKQAINNFEKALGADSAHAQTLEALVALYSELRDWKQVVAYKRQLLDSVVEADARFKMLGEIAELWRDQDKNPAKALETYEEARDLQPNNIPLLHAMLALYQQTESWARMIDTIQAISDLERDPVRKSKFIYTMAQLYRDKESDQDRALELFNQALDLNPTFLEAFERINKILTARKDWKELERAFRRMLKRLAPTTGQNADLEFNLWHTLGIIYRDRLHDSKSAIEAFKMATRYKPEEAVERQILAELYEAADQIEAAIGEHTIVLQRDPLRIDPYRSLYKLYTRTQQHDRAWCMAAALAFLRKADPDEQRFFEDYRPRGMLPVKSRLDNEQWVKNLFHKDENIYIGKIFEMITPAAIISKTNQLRQARQLPVLDKRFKQDPATSTVTFAKTFGWAAQVLSVQAPELYIRNDIAGALAAVAAVPPASVAGQSVLTGFSPQELTFIVSKHLSTYRGEHYIRSLFPTMNELKVLLFAAIKLIVSDFAVPADMEQAVNLTAVELVKHMQPIARDSLRLVVQKFMEDGARADLKRWMQTVEITGARAGLLLCADLEIARKIIGAEPQLPGDLSSAEKMKELLVFSVSEQYFALRTALGIAVGG